MEAKTSSYLSNLKVIATFLVVLVHSKNLLGYASYTEHNPLINLCDIFAAAGILIFFLVSGYLLFCREFKWAENMKKKCRTLVVPFLIWNSFWLLFELVGKLFLPAYFDIRFTQGLSGWLVGFFGIPFGRAPFYTPLWFVRELFLLNIAAPVLKWIIDRFPVWLTMGILLILWFLPLPYKTWYNLCQSIVFFTLGGMIARNKITFSVNRSAKITAILCCAVITLAACIPGMNMWSYYSRFLLLLATATLCIGTAVLNMHRISVFMPYSFSIYVLHGKLLSVLQILYTRLLPQTGLVVTVGYFLLPAVVVALCIAAASVFKRYAPRLFAIATGSR